MRVHPAYARRHKAIRPRASYAVSHGAYGNALGAGAAGLAGVGLLAVVGLVVAGPFIVGPFIVKAFKPEWSYGRRLGASLAFSIVSGTLVSIARGLGGVQDKPSTSADPTPRPEKARDTLPLASAETAPSTSAETAPSTSAETAPSLNLSTPLATGPNRALGTR